MCQRQHTTHCCCLSLPLHTRRTAFLFLQTASLSGCRRRRSAHRLRRRMQPRCVRLLLLPSSWTGCTRCEHSYYKQLLASKQMQGVCLHLLDQLPVCGVDARRRPGRAPHLCMSCELHIIATASILQHEPPSRVGSKITTIAMSWKRANHRRRPACRHGGELGFLVLHKRQSIIYHTYYNLKASSSK